MDDARTGKTYGAGVALATAKKQAKANCGAPITTHSIVPSWVTYLQQIRSVV